MKLEDQVKPCSFKLAMRLKELGEKQESLWYWNKYITGKPILSQGKQYEDELALDGTYIKYSCSAYTVAEFGERLPDSVNVDNKKYFLFITKTKKTEYFTLPDYYISYKNLDDEFLHSEREDTEADARAKMRIYLLENKLIEIEQ